MNWGEAEARLGKFAEAEAILQRALGLKSDYPRARFSLGYTAADFANPGGRGGIGASQRHEFHPGERFAGIR